MTKDVARSHITTSGTTTPITVNCNVSQIVISCSNAGTAWTLKIQDKASTPLVLVPAFTLSVPSTGQPIEIPYTNPITAVGGLDIITAGTPGVVDVWIHNDRAGI